MPPSCQVQGRIPKIPLIAVNAKRSNFFRPFFGGLSSADRSRAQGRGVKGWSLG